MIELVTAAFIAALYVGGFVALCAFIEATYILTARLEQRKKPRR